MNWILNLYNEVDAIPSLWGDTLHHNTINDNLEHIDEMVEQLVGEYLEEQ